MRPPDAARDAYLDSTTAGFNAKHILTVTPRSGSVVRWTDYFQDLVVGGNTYRSGGEGTTHPKVVVGDREEVEGLEIGKLALSLDCGNVALFNGTRLTTFAALRGFDGTLVLVERLYPNPAGGWFNPMHLFSGRVGRVLPGSFRIEMEIESGVALLASIELPRTVFQSGCEHMLFDAECTLVKATFTVTGTVSAGATTTVVPTSRTEATGTTNSQGWFALGVITFTSGANNGLSRAIRSYSGTGGTFTLDEPLPVAPANGDTFSVHPGCPKTKAACENNTASAGPQFNNVVHLRAFPFVPRNEVAL